MTEFDNDLTRQLIKGVFFGIAYPLFWLCALAVPLWLVRKYIPKAEWWLFSPITGVIRRLIGLAFRRHPTNRQIDQAIVVRSDQHRAGRE